MRKDLTCPKCGNGQLWNVRTMREEAGVGVPVEMAVTIEQFGWDLVPRGRYETLVCRACGFTQWYGRDLDERTRLESLPLDCPECELQRPFWTVPLVHERGTIGQPTELRVFRKGFPKLWGEGHFQTYLCSACGYTRWFARGMANVDADPTNGLFSFDEGACPACANRRRFRIETMTEIGDLGIVPIHVLLRAGLLFYQAVGKFGTLVCRDCGYTEWFAREFTRLRHDPKRGVSLLERAAHSKVGPYR
jgi:predicted nucleic-acid-binding Zn-ribbon protein